VDPSKRTSTEKNRSKLIAQGMKIKSLLSLIAHFKVTAPVANAAVDHEQRVLA
jgi:hypothetical protein